MALVKRSPLKIQKTQALKALVDLHADTVNDVRFDTTEDMQIEAAALEIAIRMVRDFYNPHGHCDHKGIGLPGCSLCDPRVFEIC